KRQGDPLGLRYKPAWPPLPRILAKVFLIAAETAVRGDKPMKYYWSCLPSNLRASQSHSTCLPSLTGNSCTHEYTTPSDVIRRFIVSFCVLHLSINSLYFCSYRCWLSAWAARSRPSSAFNSASSDIRSPVFDEHGRH